MRNFFSKYIEQHIAPNEEYVFLTGDLGYNALEGVEKIMGDRFINAGVAEQNMVGMAAGIASQQLQVLCYSIAPFVVYRCLEQVRNDVCFHKLPVYIVGNGGGYGYGIMGSSHHAIEDIAVLGCLPNMLCYAPSYLEDLEACMRHMTERKLPAYLRLGLGKKMPEKYELTSYGAVCRAAEKAQLTIAVQGPIANNVHEALLELTAYNTADVFLLNKLPIAVLPDEFCKSAATTGNVLIVEEHVASGGLGSAVSLLMRGNGISVKKFIHLCAVGYPTGQYGSQGFHQQQSGLDVSGIAATIQKFSI
jgi:transketolase